MGVLYALQSIRTPFLDKAMQLITELGGETAFIVIAIIIFWCVNKSYGYYILTVGFTGTVLNQFLKLAFRFPRPWVIDENFSIVESAREGASGYSFPSGHTQNVFASFGSMARWTDKRLRRFIFTVIIVLVAFSRMYLGVHTPLDVSVSCAAGLILVLALYPLFRDMQDNPRSMYFVFSAMLLLSAAFAVYTETWSFPADIDLDNLASGRKSAYTMLGSVSAMFLSFHLDRKYIRFDTRAAFPAQLVKTALGLGIMLLLRSLLKAPLAGLLGDDIGSAARYFIVVLFAGAVWPMTFRWFKQLGVKG